METSAFLSGHLPPISQLGHSPAHFLTQIGQNHRIGTVGTNHVFQVARELQFIEIYIFQPLGLGIFLSFHHFLVIKITK